MSMKFNTGVKKTFEYERKHITPFEFDIDNLSFAPIPEIPTKFPNYAAWCEYYISGKQPGMRGQNLIIFTDPIKLTQGGITPAILDKTTQKQMYPDSQRLHIKLPFDETQENSVKLFEILQQIDNKLEESRSFIFEKLTKNNSRMDINKYSFYKLVKESFDEQGNKKSFTKKNGEVIQSMDMCKLSFQTVKKEDDPTNQETIDLIITNEITGEDTRVSSIKEAEKLIPRGCTVRCIFKITSVWAQKWQLNKQLSGGIKPICTRIYITEMPQVYSGGFDNTYDARKFENKNLLEEEETKISIDELTNSIKNISPIKEEHKKESTIFKNDDEEEYEEEIITNENANDSDIDDDEKVEKVETKKVSKGKKTTKK